MTLGNQFIKLSFCLSITILLKEKSFFKTFFHCFMVFCNDTLRNSFWGSPQLAVIFDQLLGFETILNEYEKTLLHDDFRFEEQPSSLSWITQEDFKILLKVDWHVLRNLNFIKLLDRNNLKKITYFRGINLSHSWRHSFLMWDLFWGRTSELSLYLYN